VACHDRLTQNEHLQRAFAHFDRDNSGDISADEIMEALKGQGVSQSEADELLAEWDANRDGVIRCAAVLREP
jgi:calcium-dependent protein kinase